MANTIIYALHSRDTSGMVASKGFRNLVALLNKIRLAASICIRTTCNLVTEVEANMLPRDINYGLLVFFFLTIYELGLNTLRIATVEPLDEIDKAKRVSNIYRV